MVYGDKCPECGSNDVSDDSFNYTYDNPSKVIADWICNNCNSQYEVIYKAEKMIIEKYIGDDWKEPYEKYLN